MAVNEDTIIDNVGKSRRTVELTDGTHILKKMIYKQYNTIVVMYRTSVAPECLKDI